MLHEPSPPYTRWYIPYYLSHAALHAPKDFLKIQLLFLEDIEKQV